MDVTITNSVLVQPAHDTPSEAIWLSNVDLIFSKFYVRTTYIYGSIEEPDICVWQRLREALPKVLVYFYPLAGRLINDSSREFAIDCNSEGVLFVEAVTDSDIEDLRDFSSISQLSSLAPTMDYTQSITSLPLLLLQVTKFKCGGVALGVTISHMVADGMSSLHFVNTWCDMAHGLDMMVPPYVDRTLLQARNPPQPFFPHPLCLPFPKLLHKEGQEEGNFPISFKRFRLSKEQLNCLKEKAKDDSSKEAFTSFIALTAHIWKCVCISGNLLKQQETKLYIPMNGRERIRPVLPCGYFGNAIFHASPIDMSENIVSQPISYIATKIAEEVNKIDDHYIRSQIDYLELNPNLKIEVSRQGKLYPSMVINNWAHLPIYATNFGWGKPLFMGLTLNAPEGYCCIKPNSENDGSLIIEITLRSDRMDRFGKLLYEF
ncbi:hypothetical protein SUGI_0686990 [Cryptomeria japonica]|uniref:shikimate O-hydroxycinnamoyltransferase n=1 Tax=Cryptomeria japonica TaxID=3369 RepID=UPI0024147E7D|nr:shikimate O-hydroxycinnamoyltransferase [Cryptomeria japonica]GLJ34177.1 hypothetical protein SUGI_0686990 [Cryptomeria japonica]